MVVEAEEEGEEEGAIVVSECGMSSRFANGPALGPRVALLWISR
jgi:hypothetical protein